MKIERRSVWGGEFTTDEEKVEQWPLRSMATPATGGFPPPSRRLPAMIIFSDGGGGRGHPFDTSGNEVHCTRVIPVAAARRAQPHSRPLTAAAGDRSLPPLRRAASNDVQRRRGVNASVAPRVAGRVAASASQQGHQQTGGCGQRRAS